MKFTQVLVERCPTCGETPFLSMKESYGGMDFFKLECPNHYAVEEQGYLETVNKWNYWVDIMREAKAREDSIEFWSGFIGKESDMIDDVFEERESTVRRSRADGVFGQHHTYFDPTAIETERKLHENHFELEMRGEMPVEEPSPEMREAVKQGFNHNHGLHCGYDPRDSSWYSQEVGGEKNDPDYGVSRLEVGPDGGWRWVPVEEEEEPNVAEVFVRDDPWQHRSEHMKCETCMWYVPKCNAFDEETDIGRCRRHAPTMNGYPVVYWSDWCGDHKLDEDKL